MNFEMVGKLSISKESDKFKPYSETKYEKSGWVRKRLMFNAICGDNRHMLTIDAGAFGDGHGDIYTFTKGGVDENGKRVKGESLKIPFKDRLTSPKLSEVAEFKKFIVDLEEPQRRTALKNAAEKVKEGTSLTDSELSKLGLENEADVEKALEESYEKYHSFISEWDFVDFVRNLIQSGEYANRKFFIRGNGEYSYSDKTQKCYENYIPNRIYLAKDDEPERSECSFSLLFGSESLDDMSLEDMHKYYVNGYIMEYVNDGNRKGNLPIPTTITFSDENEKIAKALVKKFTVLDDKIYELPIKCNMINGAQKTDIKLEDLDEEVQADIELGLISLEDVIRDMGGSVYGDRIREYQFAKLGVGGTKGRSETAYSAEDMIIKPIVDDLTEDLFDDEDDI